MFHPTMPVGSHILVNATAVLNGVVVGTVLNATSSLALILVRLPYLLSSVSGALHNAWALILGCLWFAFKLVGALRRGMASDVGRIAAPRCCRYGVAGRLKARQAGA